MWMEHFTLQSKRGEWLATCWEIAVRKGQLSTRGIEVHPAHKCFSVLSLSTMIYHISERISKKTQTNKQKIIRETRESKWELVVIWLDFQTD